MDRKEREPPCAGQIHIFSDIILVAANQHLMICDVAAP